MTLKFFDQSTIGLRNGDYMTVEMLDSTRFGPTVVFKTEHLPVGTAIYLRAEQVRKIYNTLGTWLQKHEVLLTPPKLWEEIDE